MVRFTFVLVGAVQPATSHTISEYVRLFLHIYLMPPTLPTLNSTLFVGLTSPE